MGNHRVERLHNSMREREKVMRHLKKANSAEKVFKGYRAYYNFVRPHLGLKFGRVVRTPAMQAGLAARKLTFREIFMSAAGLLLFAALLIDFAAGRHTLRKQGLAA